MATTKNILVPLDFSKHSQAALHRAIVLARELRAKLLLVHVITAPAATVPLPYRAQYYNEFEQEAIRAIERLLRRKKVPTEDYRLVILRGDDAAQLVVQQAAKSRSFMIVMGSQGRTGLRRLILGSVAEKTLRYAKCPILIVKR
jgi:nucleotide-binding universal stress UspA family protein